MMVQQEMLTTEQETRMSRVVELLGVLGAWTTWTTLQRKLA